MAKNGALTPIPEPPLPTLGTPVGIKVSRDGRFLAVGFITSGPGPSGVQMFSIADEGTLTSLGVFPEGGTGTGVLGVDINCGTNLLYGGEVNPSTIVDGYFISHSGALSPIPGSPFEPGVGINSPVVLLSNFQGREKGETHFQGPDKDETLFQGPHKGEMLFVSNQGSDTVSAFIVTPACCRSPHIRPGNAGSGLRTGASGFPSWPESTTPPKAELTFAQ